MSEPSGFDAKAAEGIEHLQAAALEVIAAARAMLDVAEHVVREPGAAATIVHAAAGAGRAFFGGTTGPAGPPGRPPEEGKVRRIDVS